MILFIVCYLKTLVPSQKQNLLIISKEDLDRQPSVSADLEPLWQRVNLLDLLSSELPAIQLKVALNARRSNRLGNDRSTALKTPHEKNLLHRLAL